MVAEIQRLTAENTEGHAFKAVRLRYFQRACDRNQIRGSV